MADRRQTPLNWNLNDRTDLETMQWLEEVSGQEGKKGNISGVIKRIVFEYVERQKSYKHAENLIRLLEAGALDKKI